MKLQKPCTAGRGGWSGCRGGGSGGCRGRAEAGESKLWAVFRETHLFPLSSCDGQDWARILLAATQRLIHTVTWAEKHKNWCVHCTHARTLTHKHCNWKSHSGYGSSENVRTKFSTFSVALQSSTLWPWRQQNCCDSTLDASWHSAFQQTKGQAPAFDADLSRWLANTPKQARWRRSKMTRKTLSSLVVRTVSDFIFRG